MKLLGQIEVKQWGLATFARYPFSALSVSEPELAGALIKVGQDRFPDQVRGVRSLAASIHSRSYSRCLPLCNQLSVDVLQPRLHDCRSGTTLGIAALQWILAAMAPTLWTRAAALQTWRPPPQSS